MEPEARTFNTIIIACNLCGQPLQALEVSSSHCLNLQSQVPCCAAAIAWRHAALQSRAACNSACSIA